MFQFMFIVQLLVKFKFFIQELWERKSLQILYECWRRAYHALLAQLLTITIKLLISFSISEINPGLKSFFSFFFILHCSFYKYGSIPMILFLLYPIWICLIWLIDWCLRKSFSNISALSQQCHITSINSCAKSAWYARRQHSYNICKDFLSHNSW
jgi:hypothetical protein